MANVVFKAVAEAKEGLATKVVSRDFEITLDEPADLGGTDTGMNPVEALLGSLAACKSIVVRAFVKKYRINLKSIRVEVEGDLDPEGFQGINKEAKIGFSEIRSHFYIEADNSEEEIERYIEFVERNCPVQDTLTKVAKITHTING
ncbi:MAG: OsmC family protein [Clostridiaceae bacterium]|nr:OsmC family protein [Clostridiaceae bacterium]